MTDRKSLTELLEKVEAAEISSPLEFRPLTSGDEMIVDSRSRFAYKAFHGSLDAAKALHEAVLPGWTRAVDATFPEAKISVYLFCSGQTKGPGEARGDDLNEARAWLIAILKTLIARVST